MKGSIFVEQAFEEIDGAEEVVIEGEQEVDVVVIFVAVEAVGRLLRGLRVACIWLQLGQRKRK